MMQRAGITAYVGVLAGASAIMFSEGAAAARGNASGSLDTKVVVLSTACNAFAAGMVQHSQEKRYPSNARGQSRVGKYVIAGALAHTLILSCAYGAGYISSKAS